MITKFTKKVRYDLYTRCDMHTYAATVYVLSRQCFAPPGINYLRTMNAVTLMAFKFLLHDLNDE